ncbi:MAG: hypothetical protein ACTHJL_09255 [Amnibacterium sp.]
MPEELEALRRRLYRPDATDADRARYRELVRAEVRPDTQDGPSEEPPGTAGSPARRGRPLLVGAAVTVVVALLAVGIAVTARPASAPAPTPTGPAFGDTGFLVPADARAAFVHALLAGRPAGLLRYVFDHPDALPPQLRTVGRADSVESSGTGHGEVVLEPSAAADRGGRLTIAVTVARPVDVSWTCIRTHAATTQAYFEVLDAEHLTAEPGLPAVRTFTYGGEAPTIVAVQVPTGVHWDVVAVFTD